MKEHDMFFMLKDRASYEMRRKVERAMTFLRSQIDATLNTVDVFERHLIGEMIDAEREQYLLDIKLGKIDSFKCEGGRLNGREIQIYGGLSHFVLPFPDEPSLSDDEGNVYRKVIPTELYNRVIQAG
jgi:hypothetical protein